ncbi:hypothetical protein [Streptomyces sp. RerS4]|uniref:hypothetical protein n=1 Tax=Streptomyces sp. RerS4 TaxID=2942449 RepID=UPI00201C0169|nr:hypothetical protein [Streptomyces sp. RerS4]UQW99569.1 hypothetical protein M4D82_02725 [Streptomyces sp. RerS4]
MNVSSKPSSPAGALQITLVFGFLAIAISLISVALTLADGLGAGPTAALIGADVILFAAMGALAASLPAEWQRTDRGEAARDEERLDALEPLGPLAPSADGGR